MALDILKQANPVLSKVGDTTFDLAKFVTTQLNWVLKCDREFFYHGEKTLYTGHNPEVLKLLEDVCSILNNVLANLSTKQQDLFAKSFLSSFNFNTNGNSVSVEVRGTRDVPSLFPVKQVLYKIDEQKANSISPSIPQDLARAMFTDELLKSLKNHTTSATNVAEPNIQPAIARNTFAARLELERQNKVQQVVAAA